jgi:putative flippase GtrA
MSLPRQGVSFLVVGGIQLLVDWALFVASTHWGAPVEAGNVLGRIGGASLGFWLNGRYTFAASGRSNATWQALARFTTLWLTTTIASTVTLSWLATQLGLAQLWLCKPLVEGALAALGFLAARHWVYRR